MSPVGRSLFQVNLSVVLLGLVPLFAKLVDLDAVSIIAWRATLGAAALLAFLALRRGGWRLERGRDYALVILLGVVMAVHWSSFFHAIQISTVAVAMVAMFTWPVITVLIEPLVYGARPRPRDLGLALLALAGVGLVLPHLSLNGAAMHGVAWGLFSALLYALRNVYYRRYLAHYPGSRMMAYQLVVIALCLLPFASLPARSAGLDWALLALLGLVFTAFAHTLFVASMRRLQAKTAGMISCLQPAYGIAAAALLLDETTTLQTWLGAALVMAVAIIESIGAPRGHGAHAGCVDT
jgi:drug/metabolite transporter (DMT)-like permease